MGYVGNKPALNYTSFAVQHFTTSATTSYSLDHAVNNENDIRLVINNVVQQPGSSYAYTASGTTLTLSSATAGTDTMYCVFLGKAVQTVSPSQDSVGTSQLQTNAVTQVKMADDSVGTAEILDNNVTLAKLADGTQGDVLYYGASGAPTLLGAGTSGHFLKTQGSSANPVWASASSDYVRIAENGGSSGTAGVNFDDVFDGGTYQHYRVIGFIAGAVNAGCDMYWRTGGSSGSTYTTSDYSWVESGRYIDNGGSAGDYNVADYSDSKFRIATDCRVDSNATYATFDFLIADPDTNLMSRGEITGTVAWVDNTGVQLVTASFAGRNTANVNATGLRFQMESNNITWRRIQLWGYKRA